MAGARTLLALRADPEFGKTTEAWIRRVDVAGIPELESRENFELGVQGLRGFESSKMRAEAEMPPPAECLMMCIPALDVETIRIRVGRGILIGHRQGD